MVAIPFALTKLVNSPTSPKEVEQDLIQAEEVCSFNQVLVVCR